MPNNMRNHTPNMLELERSEQDPDTQFHLQETRLQQNASLKFSILRIVLFIEIRLVLAPAC